MPERKQLKNNLQEIIAKAESQAQEQVTRRWEADSKGRIGYLLI